MVYSYSQCIEKYKSDYQLKKAVKRGDLYKIEKGIYSDVPKTARLEVIAAKYPEGVFTLDNAFYYYNLTDVIPEDYYIATASNAPAITDDDIRQIFMPEKVFSCGVTSMTRRGVKIRIYSREKLLVELLRYKNKLPYDYYKEIIRNYRKIADELNMEEVQEYIEKSPKKDLICRRLEEEVL